MEVERYWDVSGCFGVCQIMLTDIKMMLASARMMMVCVGTVLVRNAINVDDKDGEQEGVGNGGEGAGNTGKGMGKVAEETAKCGGRKKVPVLPSEELAMAKTADLQAWLL
jgi:hypothetical protein